MKYRKVRTKSSQRGVALVTALVFCFVLSLFIAGSLLVSRTNYKLSFGQSRSEAAVLLAEAGINEEVRFLALNDYASDAFSSYPVNYLATYGNPTHNFSDTYPGDQFPVLGRVCTVPNWTRPDFSNGYQNSSYYFAWSYSSIIPDVTTSLASDMPNKWDGITTPFYITSSASVNGEWARVRAQVAGNSLFNDYALFADRNGAALVGNTGDQLEVDGTLGTNGTRTLPSVTATTVYNASGSTALTSANVTAGGQVLSSAAAVALPSTSIALRRFMRVPSSTDAFIWDRFSTHTTNATGISNHDTLGVYQFNTGVTPSVANLTTGNCGLFTLAGGGTHTTTLNDATVNTAHSSALIFEPGDYYFSSVNLTDPSIKIFIDPQALASGGTPGQVRFWIYNQSAPASGATPDVIAVNFIETKPAGATTPDPGNFRIYYGNDSYNGSYLKIDASASATNIQMYGAILAVTAPGFPGASSTYPVNYQGCKVAFVGAGGGGSYVQWNGCCLCDIFSSTNDNRVAFQRSTTGTDIPGSVYVTKYLGGNTN